MERQEKQYYTKTELKEQGWTDGAIKKFLGKPDRESPNPYSKKKPTVKLFDIDRVREVRESEACCNWFQKMEQRRHQRQQREAEKIRQLQAFREEYPYLKQTEVSFSRERLMNASAPLPEGWAETAEVIVTEMLQRSRWYPVCRLIREFHRDFPLACNSEPKIKQLEDKIASEGWQGYPLIANQIPDEDKVIRQQKQKTFLWTGAHRLEALKRLYDQGQISDRFLVPVFFLDPQWTWLTAKLPREDQWARSCEPTPWILKILSKEGSGFFELITGMDNW